jgi:hypothetical protein
LAVEAVTSPLLPLFKTSIASKRQSILPGHTGAPLRADVIAALSVAMTALPVSLDTAVGSGRAALIGLSRRLARQRGKPPRNGKHWLLKLETLDIAPDSAYRFAPCDACAT